MQCSSEREYARALRSWCRASTVLYLREQRVLVTAQVLPRYSESWKSIDGKVANRNLARAGRDRRERRRGVMLDRSACRCPTRPSHPLECDQGVEFCGVSRVSSYRVAGCVVRLDNGKAGVQVCIA